VNKSATHKNLSAADLFTTYCYYSLMRWIKNLHFYFLILFRGCPKDVRSQGEGICPVRTFCGLEGFFRCGRPHFFVQKHRIFQNFWCVRMDKEKGVSQCGHFADKERVNFSRFCVDVVYWQPLIQITTIELITSFWRQQKNRFGLRVKLYC